MGLGSVSGQHLNRCTWNPTSVASEASDLMPQGWSPGCPLFQTQCGYPKSWRCGPDLTKPMSSLRLCWLEGRGGIVCPAFPELGSLLGLRSGRSVDGEGSDSWPGKSLLSHLPTVLRPGSVTGPPTSRENPELGVLEGPCPFTVCVMPRIILKISPELPCTCPGQAGH